MMNLEYEISRKPPPGIDLDSLTGGIPILYAYGCVLLEDDVGDYLLYKVVNLETKKQVKLMRRKNPIAPMDIPKVAERIAMSKVAGAGRLEADRHYGQSIRVEKCREILRIVFQGILPRYGYAVRKEQITLSESILETICKRAIILAEAEVGTGKTLAYLVAAILAKRGRLNDFWNKAYYPHMSYADMAHMPIVIATSSIALQKAIQTEYIPALSDILVENGIIQTPITAVLRKGREHHVCELNLRSALRFEHDDTVKQTLKALLKPNATIDIAEIDGLDRYTKRKIAVPGKCVLGCPYRDSCAYLRFREQASNPAIDIQIVNHNYFLADAKFRAADKRSLLPNYQMVIIDEAHKFLGAARSIYGTELSSASLPELKDITYSLNIRHEPTQKLVRKTARKLANESKRLYRDLDGQGHNEDADFEATRFAVSLEADALRHLYNLYDLSRTLHELLEYATVTTGSESKKSALLWELAAICEQLSALTQHREHICWLEKPNIHTTPGAEQELRLCTIPKDLDVRLYDDLWRKGIPVVLTSGTLSAAGDFSHIKRTLGLECGGIRISEASSPSPFNHRENALLYISENVSFPDQSNREYISAVADEIERLVLASHGHAAVLFTSYKAMDMVWELLAKRKLPFPMLRLGKGGIREIERFKQSGNGILFAAGALWEGIDIPGDALSMLIIVKLPFAVPDPISEYEQAQYDNFRDYRDCVVVPEMLIKLKQGFGRLIRMESDTGAVAILDSRAGLRGAYRERVLNALPDCRVTASVKDIETFIKAVKSPEYFI